MQRHTPNNHKIRLNMKILQKKTITAKIVPKKRLQKVMKSSWKIVQLMSVLILLNLTLTINFKSHILLKNHHI